MSAKFWESPTYKIVKKMKATGNQPGVVRLWKAMVEHWAKTHTGPDAEAVKAWLPLWQERPFYLAEELAPIFPALAVTLGISKFDGRMPTPMSPARLASALKFAGLPFRVIGNRTYFIVEQIHLWQKADQADFMEFL